MQFKLNPFLVLFLAFFAPCVWANDLGGGRSAGHGRVPRFVLTSWLPGTQATFKFIDPSPSMTFAIGMIAPRSGSVAIPNFGILTLDPLSSPFLAFSIPTAGLTFNLPIALLGTSLCYQGAWFDPLAKGAGFTDGTRADFFNPICMVCNSRQTSNSVSVIDPTASKVTQTLPNSENGYVTFSPFRKWAFVCEPGLQRNRVVIYDLSKKPITVSGTVSVSGGIRYGCAVSPQAHRLYVPVHDGIAVIDLVPSSPNYRKEIKKLATSITGNTSSIFTGPLDVAITPDGKKLYVAFGESTAYPAKTNIGVYDLTKTNPVEKLIPVTTGGSLSMLGSFVVSTRNRIVVSPDGLFVYSIELGLNPAALGAQFVLGFKNGALVNVIFTPTDKEFATIATGGFNQTDLCVDRMGRNLWVAQLDNNHYGEVLRVDVDKRSLGQFKTLKKIRIHNTPYKSVGAGPHGIDVTPDGRLVMTSVVEDGSHPTPQVITIDSTIDKIVGQPIPVGSLCQNLSIQQR